MAHYQTDISVPDKNGTINGQTTKLAFQDPTGSKIQPGTPILLEGIICQEGEGVIVVKVQWQKKTFTGSLIDMEQHEWAPPKHADISEVGSPINKIVNSSYQQKYGTKQTHLLTDTEERPPKEGNDTIMSPASSEAVESEEGKTPPENNTANILPNMHLLSKSMNPAVMDAESNESHNKQLPFSMTTLTQSQTSSSSLRLSALSSRSSSMNDLRPESDKKRSQDIGMQYPKEVLNNMSVLPFSKNDIVTTPEITIKSEHPQDYKHQSKSSKLSHHSIIPHVNTSSASLMATNKDSISQKMSTSNTVFSKQPGTLTNIKSEPYEYKHEQNKPDTIAMHQPVPRKPHNYNHPAQINQMFESRSKSTESNSSPKANSPEVPIPTLEDLHNSKKRKIELENNAINNNNNAIRFQEKSERPANLSIHSLQSQGQKNIHRYVEDTLTPNATNSSRNNKHQMQSSYPLTTSPSTNVSRSNNAHQTSNIKKMPTSPNPVVPAKEVPYIKYETEYRTDPSNIKDKSRIDKKKRGRDDIGTNAVQKPDKETLLPHAYIGQNLESLPHAASQFRQGTHVIGNHPEMIPYFYSPMVFSHPQHMPVPLPPIEQKHSKYDEKNKMKAYPTTNNKHVKNNQSKMIQAIPHSNYEMMQFPAQHLLLNNLSMLSGMGLVNNKAPSADVSMDSSNNNAVVALDADKDKYVKISKSTTHASTSNKQHNDKISHETTQEERTHPSHMVTNDIYTPHNHSRDNITPSQPTYSKHHHHQPQLQLHQQQQQQHSGNNSTPHSHGHHLSEVNNHPSQLQAIASLRQKPTANSTKTPTTTATTIPSNAIYAKNGMNSFIPLTLYPFGLPAMEHPPMLNPHTMQHMAIDSNGMAMIPLECMQFVTQPQDPNLGEQRESK